MAFLKLPHTLIYNNKADGEGGMVGEVYHAT